MLTVGLGIVLGSGVAIAGDQLAVISPSPYDVEADPGDEVEIEVVMQSQGGHSGEGVETIHLVAQYHPDYVEITDIESAEWLEQGENTEIVEDEHYFHEAGTVILEKERDPVEGGATGRDTVATVTAQVAEDAEPAQTSISFGNSLIYLERQFQLPIHDQEVTISIDGSEEAHEPFDHPHPEDREELEAMADSADSADDTGGDADPDDSPDKSDEAGDDETGDTDDGTEGDDPIPGFAAVTAIVALTIATALAVRGRSSPPSS